MSSLPRPSDIKTTASLLAIPFPLVDQDRRLIVLWSPKSACTTTYVWFSAVCGFADEVRRSGPHKHRTSTYALSERHRKSVQCDTSDFHVVKIIRDPYTRAISIFRNAFVSKFADRDAAAAGLDFATGVSFRDFLEMVAGLNMEYANIHYRPQRHPFEDIRKPDTIINISNSDLFQELNALESRMGWPVTDFKSLDWLHTSEAKRAVNPLADQGLRMFNAPIVRAHRRRETPFPDYHALLTPAAKRLIERIYRVDFQSYRRYL